MIVCSSCWCQNDAGAVVCWNCRGSLAPPAKKAPRKVEPAPSEPTPEQRLARAFVCPKGCGAAPKSKRIAATGTAAGHSRIFDIQEHRYAAISCSRCGFTELYDLEVVSGPDRAGPDRAGPAKDALLGG